MDAAMDAGIGKGWMSGQGDGERCRDKATVLQGNGLGLHRWRWRRERTKGWMQASGRSVTRAESSSGESKVFWRTVWGLLSVWGHRGDRLHRWRWPAKATAHRGSVTWPWPGASRRWHGCRGIGSVTWPWPGASRLHRWRWRRQLRIAASVTWHGAKTQAGSGRRHRRRWRRQRSWTAVLDCGLGRAMAKATDEGNQRTKATGPRQRSWTASGGDGEGNCASR